MTKTTKMIIGVILVFIILGALAIVAFSRGIVYFTGWRPHVSTFALTHPRPSLNRPTAFSSDFTPEARQIFNTNLAKTKAQITANSRDISAWFDLAILYRMVGDYAGAAEIWEYVSALYPADPVSLHNLGEYYFHTVKDYPKAEGYYRRSLAVGPKLEQDYLDLADMYIYVYKQDTTAAADILKEGISKIDPPHNVNLMIRLASYYAEKNDSKNARVYYDQALQVARALGNTALVKQLNQDISRLK